MLSLNKRSIKGPAAEMWGQNSTNRERNVKNKDSVSSAFSIAAISVLSVSLLVVNYAWQRKTAWAERLTDKLSIKQMELDRTQNNLRALKRDMDVLNKKLTAMVAADSVRPAVSEPVAAPAIVPAEAPEVPAAAAPETNTKS